MSPCRLQRVNRYSILMLAGSSKIKLNFVLQLTHLKAHLEKDQRRDCPMTAMEEFSENFQVCFRILRARGRSLDGFSHSSIIRRCTFPHRMRCCPRFALTTCSGWSPSPPTPGCSIRVPRMRRAPPGALGNQSSLHGVELNTLRIRLTSRRSSGFDLPLPRSFAFSPFGKGADTGSEAKSVHASRGPRPPRAAVGMRKTIKYAFCVFCKKNGEEERWVTWRFLHSQAQPLSSVTYCLADFSSLTPWRMTRDASRVPSSTITRWTKEIRREQRQSRL